MSYAGPTRSSAPSRHASRSTLPGTSRTTSSSAAPGYSAEFAESRGETDWQEVALFGAGLALGVILGAGGALLSAPRTGAETRAALSARAARFRRATVRSSQDAWDELRDELRQAKRNRRERKRQRALEA
jgi:uncharacterized membrane protein YfcA